MIVRLLAPKLGAAASGSNAGSGAGAVNWIGLDWIGVGAEGNVGAVQQASGRQPAKQADANWRWPTACKANLRFHYKQRKRFFLSFHFVGSFCFLRLSRCKRPFNLVHFDSAKFTAEFGARNLRAPDGI